MKPVGDSLDGVDEALQLRASRPYWRAGWVTDGDGPAHRLDPLDIARVMCGKSGLAVGEVQHQRPAGAECGPCCVQIYRARKKALRELRNQPATKARRVKITDPDDVDRYDRARMRGSSVTTVSGGLPGLGKR